MIIMNVSYSLLLSPADFKAGFGKLEDVLMT